MARALAPITGRIYECNRTDDRVGKSVAHCLWGESIYELLGGRYGYLEPKGVSDLTYGGKAWVARTGERLV